MFLRPLIDSYCSFWKDHSVLYLQMPYTYMAVVVAFSFTLLRSCGQDCRYLDSSEGGIEIKTLKGKRKDSKTIIIRICQCAECLPYKQIYICIPLFSYLLPPRNHNSWQLILVLMICASTYSERIIC